MNKKEYMTPDFRIVVLKSQNRLLAGSAKHMSVSLRNSETPLTEVDSGEDLD